MRDDTIIEQLRYRFSPDEHLRNCDQLAAKLDHQSELEANHKAIKANLKEQEERVAAEIGKLVRVVRDKFDMRNVACQWSMNSLGFGQKTLVRIDTYDNVRTVAMLDHERQESLDLQATKDAEAAAASD